MNDPAKNVELPQIDGLKADKSGERLWEVTPGGPPTKYETDEWPPFEDFIPSFLLPESPVEPEL